MSRSSNTVLAVLSAAVVGIVNIASMGAVYAVFSSTHEPPESEFTKIGEETVASSKGTGSPYIRITDPVDGTGGQTAASDNGVTENGNPAQNDSSGSGEPASGSAGSTTGSSSGTPSGTGGNNGSSKPTTPSPTPTPTPVRPSSPSPTPTAPAPTPPPPPAPPSEPVSLKKGPPCQTQTPPAGVCQAVLSFNSQKDGNPYWNPSLLVAIKQGIADNSFVKAFGLNVDNIYNSMQITLQESTWSGNAVRGTIKGKMGAAGQSENTTFTLDWNGSKWIVNEVAKG